MRGSGIGLETDGLGKLRQRAVEIHMVGQCDAQVQMGFGRVRHQLDYFVESLNRFPRVAQSGFEHA